MINGRYGMAKKSVVIHCRMEVVDFNEEVEKRAGQEALKNRGVWPPISEVPGLDLNEGRPYRIFFEGEDRLRYGERLMFADWFAIEAVKAVINSGKNDDKIPHCLFIRKEKDVK